MVKWGAPSSIPPQQWQRGPRRQKRAIPASLTPSLLADQSPWAHREQHQATSGEARGIENSKLQLVWKRLVHTCCCLHRENKTKQYIHTNHIKIYPWTDGVSFPDQEEAAGSFTSALSHSELHVSLLFHFCPSLSFSLSSSGSMKRLLHICKWITLFVEIPCVCVCVCEF